MIDAVEHALDQARAAAAKDAETAAEAGASTGLRGLRLGRDAPAPEQSPSSGRRLKRKESEPEEAGEDEDGDEADEADDDEEAKKKPYTHTEFGDMLRQMFPEFSMSEFRSARSLYYMLEAESDSIKMISEAMNQQCMYISKSFEATTWFHVMNEVARPLKQNKLMQYLEAVVPLAAPTKSEVFQWCLKKKGDGRKISGGLVKMKMSVEPQPQEQKGARRKRGKAKETKKAKPQTVTYLADWYNIVVAITRPVTDLAHEDKMYLLGLPLSCIFRGSVTPSGAKAAIKLYPKLVQHAVKYIEDKYHTTLDVDIKLEPEQQPAAAHGGAEPAADGDAEPAAHAAATAEVIIDMLCDDRLVKTCKDLVKSFGKDLDRIDSKLASQGLGDWLELIKKTHRALAGVRGDLWSTMLGEGEDKPLMTVGGKPSGDIDVEALVALLAELLFGVFDFKTILLANSALDFCGEKTSLEGLAAMNPKYAVLGDIWGSLKKVNAFVSMNSCWMVSLCLDAASIFHKLEVERARDFVTALDIIMYGFSGLSAGVGTVQSKMEWCALWVNVISNALVMAKDAKIAADAAAVAAAAAAADPVQLAVTPGKAEASVTSESQMLELLVKYNQIVAAWRSQLNRAHVNEVREAADELGIETQDANGKWLTKPNITKYIVEARVLTHHAQVQAQEEAAQGAETGAASESNESQKPKPKTMEDLAYALVRSIVAEGQKDSGAAVATSPAELSCSKEIAFARKKATASAVATHSVLCQCPLDETAPILEPEPPKKQAKSKDAPSPRFQVALTVVSPALYANQRLDKLKKRALGEDSCVVHKVVADLVNEHNERVESQGGDAIDAENAAVAVVDAQKMKSLTFYLGGAVEVVAIDARIIIPPAPAHQHRYDRKPKLRDAWGRLKV